MHQLIFNKILAKQFTILAVDLTYTYYYMFVSCLKTNNHLTYIASALKAYLS